MKDLGIRETFRMLSNKFSASRFNTRLGRIRMHRSIQNVFITLRDLLRARRHACKSCLHELRGTSLHRSWLQWRRGPRADPVFQSVSFASSFVKSITFSASGGY